MSDFTDRLKQVKSPKKVLCYLLGHYGTFIPDEAYLKMCYYMHLGKKLNLDNPQTFNEKLQWLKLHDRRPEYTRMVDKYEAKQYVAEKIGEEYIIPTLGVWDHFDDIDFNSLPNQFVLKCTHDSGGLVICKDKSNFDFKTARSKIKRRYKNNYYYIGREWPYKNIKPRIIAEKYMEDVKTKELRDYKFFCFGGVAKCFKIDFDRFVEHHANYFDMERNILLFGEEAFLPKYDKVLDLPPAIDEMATLAEQLTQGTPFLRADFYDVEGKIYFGELTFFPASGMGRFIPEEGDRLMGQWLRLPDTEGGGRIALLSRDFFCVLTYHNEKKDEGLKDYKIFNFDGKAKVIQVDYNRFVRHMRNLYTTNWEYIEAKINYPNNLNNKIAKPEKLEEMLKLARKLSKDFPFLRTDFYLIDDKLYFGELTFFPEAGFCEFDPEEYGLTMGEYLKLPRGGVILKCEGYIMWIHKGQDNGLKDYKLHCFNGEPKLTLVCSDRYAEEGLCEDFFDNDWGRLPIRRPSHPNAPHNIACPKNFELMKQLAAQLSENIPFMRVDFYEIDGRVYFGELTFFPMSGLQAFVPEEWDKTLGEWILLPSKNN